MALQKSVRAQKKAPTGNALTALWGLVAWLTGVLVSLAVGFGMTSGVLRIPEIPLLVTATAGWIVIILAVLGVILALIDKFTR
ncbi:hypothetical protein HYZ97_03560 [Candidatus Pacearchaeota archaeon]|nr:hypothetical protein [Candidatus Pacearchaeota archaeon]